MEFESDHSDGFDRIPDPLINLIFNHVSDIKTLIRCRSVSKRFNSLVPQADSLLLRVDRVISVTDSDEDDDSFIIAFLRSVIKSLHHLVSPCKALPNPTRSQNSPSQILREFEKIRDLQIELPSGDLRLEKGTTIRWKADFGKTLKSCVILGFRGGDGGEAELGGAGGGGGGAGGSLKMRVVWTISALIAASARHYMMVEVVNEHKELENLVIKDREDEGKVVMDKKGLRECRESQCEGEEELNNASSGNGVGLWWRSNRTTVPAVRMRMRHEARMELSDGTKMFGATLVVVRPINGGGGERSEVEEQNGDVGLALEAFWDDAVYCEAVERLLKTRSYILEMNSF
ncbi:unnamed protein product [Withania somnifera]